MQKQRFARGRGKENFSERGRYEKSQIQCYNCKKYGHYASECWNRAPNHIEGESNYIEEEHAILLAFKG